MVLTFSLDVSIHEGRGVFWQAQTVCRGLEQTVGLGHNGAVSAERVLVVKRLTHCAQCVCYPSNISYSRRDSLVRVPNWCWTSVCDAGPTPVRHTDEMQNSDISNSYLTILYVYLVCGLYMTAAYLPEYSAYVTICSRTESKVHCVKNTLYLLDCVLTSS